MFTINIDALNALSNTYVAIFISQANRIQYSNEFIITLIGPVTQIVFKSDNSLPSNLDDYQNNDPF